MRGFYIGRFQPFHDGHRYMAEEIAGEVDELVLGIGSAGDSHTTRNPFTAGERVMMVTKAVEDLDVTTYVVPIEDLDRNAVWDSPLRRRVLEQSARRQALRGGRRRGPRVPHVSP